MARPTLRTGRPVSLWTRIVGLITFVLVVGTLITGGLSLFLLERTLISTVDNDLATGMHSLRAESLDTFADPGDDTDYAPIDYAIEFRDENGSTIMTMGSPRVGGDEGIPFPDLTTEEVHELSDDPFTITDASQNRWRVLVAPTAGDGNGNGNGSVIMALPLQSVDRTLHEMALVILLVGTSVVLVGMGTGGYVAHRALEPLRELESAASQIAEGDLSQRVPVTYTSQEVHALAVSLNEMLVRIEQSFDAQTRSEEKATASEAKMRRFVGDASHELRTPLAAIRGFGELYRMGAMRTEDDVAQSMRRIEDEAQRMGSLVENLLRLARLDDNPSLDLRPMDITGPVFDAAQDLRALDPERTVMVVSLSGTALSVDPHIPIGVMGDEPSLRQVMSNLVGNANRHTPRGTPVEVAVGRARTEQTVLIEVRDHGEGISKDQREKVFERFYRTDESRQRSAAQGGGAGLGLSIAATIVEQHHGTITVLATAGGGATFRVEIPAADLPT